MGKKRQKRNQSAAEAAAAYDSKNLELQRLVQEKPAGMESGEPNTS